MPILLSRPRNVWIARGVALAIALSCIGIGASYMRSEINTLGPMPFEPEATTDQFLAILNVPHPAAQIREALRPYGRDKTLLFVGDAKESFTTQVFYTLVYLAYPARMGAVMCAGANSVTVENVPASSNISGLIFFETPPGRWAAGARQIGPRLFIAPHEGVEPWRSFCP